MADHRTIMGGYLTEVALKKYIKSGGDVNAMYEQNRTLLFKATSRGLKNIVEILLKAGANPNIPDFDRTFPIHEACSKCHIGIVRLLLKHGADINSRTCTNMTALHYAAYLNNKKMVKLIVRHRADPTIKNGMGENVIGSILDSDYVDIAKIILKYAQRNGFEIDTNSRTIWTYFNIFHKSNSSEMFLVLCNYKKYEFILDSYAIDLLYLKMRGYSRYSDAVLNYYLMFL